MQQWPGGDGEMARLVRTFDWASTSLGPIEVWPAGLRVAARLMLNTRHPMFIWWGPELIQLYNDAYRDTMGPEKHPAALGRSGRETWAEIWDVIGPQIEQVMSGGAATWHEDQLVPVTRHGDRQQVWWTYSFSPIDHEAAPNGVGGVLVICRDVTEEHLARVAARAGEERLQTVLQGIGEAFYTLDEDWRFLFASRTALDLWEMRLEDILGRRFSDCFPQALGSDVYEAHRRVMQTGVAEHMETVSPVLGRWLEVDLASTPTGGLSVALRDISARKRAEAALRESEHQQRLTLQLVPAMLWWTDAAGHDISANQQWKFCTGQDHVETQDYGWLDAIHPDDREATRAAFEHAFATGEPIERQQRIRQADDGYRWHLVRHVPVRDESGAITRWFGAAIDVHELHEMQDRQAVMVAELQHRTRNLIAVVRGVADDTMDETGPTEAFRAAFGDRLSALSRVQGLLSRSESEPITIGALVALELDALGAGAAGDRVTVAGPDVFLRPSTVQTLALALHELATNARKYGALSHEGGRLAVTWAERVEGDEHRLALDWDETGLEQAPDRTTLPSMGGGYGRELIENALPHATGARTVYALTVSGVRCTIDIAVRPGMKRTGE